MHYPIDRIAYTMAFVTLVMEHWLVLIKLILHNAEMKLNIVTISLSTCKELSSGWEGGGGD